METENVDGKSGQLWELANTDPDRFMEIIADYRQMEDRLRCRLVSHETNFNFFTAGPYQKHPMGEAALFFHAGQNGDTKIEYHVSFEMAQKWGRSEAELLETALRNMRKALFGIWTQCWQNVWEFSCQPFTSRRPLCIFFPMRNGHTVRQ